MSTKLHKSLVKTKKKNELAEMSDKEFRIPLLKIINELKEDSDKQMNEVSKSIQDLNQKVTNIDKKSSKGMEIILKENTQENC
jgi:formyltetrahydrofolate synthetase